MRIPVIGLTTYNQENKNSYPISALMHKYINAVSEAGGAPLLIPSGLTNQAIFTLQDRLDGILFTGGGDVDPMYYHADPHPRLDGVDVERDAMELSLVKAVVEAGKPFLGICRGLQVINVAMGGTLYTHIPDQHPHAIKHNYDSSSEREFLAHDVIINQGTRLADIFGEMSFPVNSLHHQGVKVMAQGFKAAGYASDGLLEAMELPGNPFGVAVQWHPEWLTSLPPAKRLFRAFLEAAGSYS